MQKQLNKRQEAKLNSFRATETHVDENIAVISGIVAFAATYNKIKAKIALLIANAQLKSASLLGIAAGKNSFREILTEKAAVTAGLIYTYAVDIENETLREEMNITPSRLRRTRDEELAPLCQMIHDRAQTHLDALRDYNFNTTKLTDLQTAITNYAAETPKPRTAISTRKITNINIAATFKDLDKLFATFDKQIESLREEHTDFVNTYFSNREIVDPPKGKKNTEDDEGNGGNNAPA